MENTTEVVLWSEKLNSGELAALAAGFSPLLIRPAALVKFRPLLWPPVDSKATSLPDPKGA